MKIEPAATERLSTASTSVQASPQAASAKAGLDAAKQSYNKSILASSMEVSLSSGNQALGLLYKSAIESLNEVLGPELGDNAIQSAYDSGLDVSPEATADRIVSQSTAFFDKYRSSNPQKDFATALQDFTKLIGGGIEKGFAEARNILDGLSVLQGDIASNIDKTFDLVQAGLQAFVDSQTRNASGNAGEQNGNSKAAAD